MRFIAYISLLVAAGCSSISHTTTAYCNGGGNIDVFYKEPKAEYKTCGNIQVRGNAFASKDGLREMMIEEAKKIGANAIIITNAREDTFTVAYGRVVKSEAIAIQLEK